MRYMTAKEIRETWLNFFVSKKHVIEQSASLIPQNDPTLLWINAGVAPLKRYFDGSDVPSSPRLTNVQKCIRTNDIDHVGKTARHHTFFEMLGNFSIGDYFKKDAVKWGFELLTDPKWFGFPKDKLYVTYYPDDLKTKKLWMDMGMAEDHLVPCEENFWEIGPGPSGPDTEIFIDRGESYDTRGVELIRDDIDNERYIEIWNIVFSQFNANPGKLARSAYPELPQKNIDTGAGLERFACVLQGTKTNFETDLFLPIMKHIEVLSGETYTGQMSFKVIADHIKALTFAISDGAMLSNEGRGYVLRRLLRRAVKHGRFLGLDKPFLYELVDDVVTMMGVFYDSLYDTKTIVKDIVKKEEEKFLSTINDGEKHLAEAIEKEGKTISGETAFKLYDTYGFPIELTIEMAEEQGVKVDKDAFLLELQKQKERSRNARSTNKSMKAQDEAYLNFTDKSLFVGYDTLQVNATVIKVFDAGIVLDKTPFYATSGGQVADQGTINGLMVTDVSKLPNGQCLHVVEGAFEEGEDVLAIVDAKTRLKTVRNHSAAHLFHQAIKDELGKHVNQQGQLVSAKSWRFDFNHFDTVDDQKVLDIESLVKHYIIEKPLDVMISEMPIDEAKKIGAMALFGEKYGNIVRVVNMGWSIELCGGTHVSNTKEIVDFAIGSYESIGSGIYRMEGVTGPDLKTAIKPFIEAYILEIESLKDKSKRLDQAFKLPGEPELVGSYQDVVNYRHYVEQLKVLIKDHEKAIERAKQKDAIANVNDFIDPSKTNQVVITQNLDNKVLKQLLDVIFDKVKGDTIFLINKGESKVSFLCKSTKDRASELVKLAASLSNGSGGGRPNMAQGGTQDLDKIDEMVKVIEDQL